MLRGPYKTFVTVNFKSHKHDLGRRPPIDGNHTCSRLMNLSTDFVDMLSMFIFSTCLITSILDSQIHFTFFRKIL